ncbi:MAG: hypothetical protein ACXV7G_10830 [Halobacteriota archaeon]
MSQENNGPISGQEHINDQIHFMNNVIQKSSEGLSDAIGQIRNGYRASFVMYIVLFFTGIFLLLFSLVYTTLSGLSAGSAFTGAVGSVEVIYSLLGSTTQKLQDSRGDLARLQTAFYAWTNEIYHWNILLGTSHLFTVRNLNQSSPSESKNPTFPDKVDELKKISDNCRECTSQMMSHIKQYSEVQGETDGKAGKGGDGKAGETGENGAEGDIDGNP